MPTRESLPVFYTITFVFAIAIGVGCLIYTRPKPIEVFAHVETDPVPGIGDAADDPCIWIHPKNPSKSMVIATDKTRGLVTYDLWGKQLQFLDHGQINNVDLRYNFPLDGKRVTLVVASNETDDTAVCYTVNPQTRQLVNIGRIKTGIDVYGTCMYYSVKNNSYYTFINSRTGEVEQWELFDAGNGQVSGKKVREIVLSSNVEGCVCDDQLGFLYIGEENKAFWKYLADPGVDDSWGKKIIDVGRLRKIQPDIEGITLYYTSDNRGYLIVSCQQQSAYALFDRRGNNEFLALFQIGSSRAIDGVTDTDGIDVTNANLGPNFPKGMMVVQDDANPGGNQNFKFIRWDAIATALNIDVDTTWDPRGIGHKMTTGEPSARTN